MGMAGYTKLFNSILASTIWRSPDTTRLVWITMLAMADKDGIVEASVPGLADMARVSIAACEAALSELLSPDPYSRSSEHEGKRIEIIDGTGWKLLNHPKYRAKMNDDERREYNRIKQKEWRIKHKQTSNNVNDSQSLSAMSAHTEAEAEADTDIRHNKNYEKPSTKVEPSNEGKKKGYIHPYLQTFCKEYENKFKRVYVIGDYAKANTQAKGLAGRVGQDKYPTALQKFLSDDSDFVANNGHTFGVFISRINAYLKTEKVRGDW